MRKLTKADKNVLRLVDDYVNKLIIAKTEGKPIEGMWRSYANAAGTYLVQYPRTKASR
jgi:hypothetical protein